MYFFKSRRDYASVLVQPDITIENPNMDPASYDHFGETILLVKDMLIISAPGYSQGSKQRVGKIYAFDRANQLKWTMVGVREFQQFGR